MKQINFFTQEQFEAAQLELAAFVQVMANQCRENGWTFEATNKAPESFKQLKETTKGKHLLIANYGCDGSIYGSAENNILFRFWHDVCHLEVDQGFSKAGEQAAIGKQLQQAQEYGLSNLAYMMFHYDTIGQVEFYFTHKKFLGNQKAFVQDCVLYGLKNAIFINRGNS